jgi:DNA-binding transcriptional ArsR family regulator
MNVNLLIDALVRQTTVLIAQLATSAGIRAPLAHVADQVFTDLVSELKEQGVGAKVIADMFGLALSTYHAKVRRLTESRTERGRSLWEAVLAFVRENDSVVQSKILERFRYDDEATVRGVLSDLTESGLVFRTGRGASTTYRIAGGDKVSEDARGKTAIENLVWLVVHRMGPVTIAQLAETLPLEESAIRRSLASLVEGGKVRIEQGDSDALYTADDCVLPVGDSAGWEAAVFDHYQAMVTAICAKLNREGPRSTEGEVVGGSTYGFTVWDGHPHEAEVLGFLERARREMVALREKVHRYNATHIAPPDTLGVLAYFGQAVIENTNSTGEEP